MRLPVIVLVLAGAASVPSFAQAPAPIPAPNPAPIHAHPAPTANAAPQAKPQTIKKTVCHRVVIEETTGSRVGSAPKVCKTIEVPAPANGAPPSERGSR